MSNQEDMEYGINPLQRQSEEPMFPTSIDEDLDGLFASSDPGERKASLNSESTHSVGSIEHNSTNNLKSAESENDQKE